MTEQQETNEPVPQLQVPANVLQSVLNYLTSRPYAEVAQLITTLLQNAKPVAEEQKSE